MKAARSFRFSFGFGVTGGNCSPDGKVLAVGGHDGELVVLSLVDGRTLLRTNAHSYAIINKIDFLPEHQLMATAGLDGYLQFWDTETWKPKSRLRADPHQIYSVAFHPDGTRAATGSAGDAPLTLWDLNSGRELARLPSPQKGLFNRLTFIDHDTLVGWAGNMVPGLADQVVIWRAPSLAQIGTIKTARSSVP